jgi:GH25 family lysozyme M1 (1,4-beta-N-acetylmuramidase)
VTDITIHWPPIEGIDLSVNNRSVDLARAKAAGIGLVGLRANVGLGDVDATLFARAQTCRRLELDFYLYGDDFARHARPQDAALQAKELAELHFTLGATVIPAIDVEPEGTGAVGSEWRESVDAYACTLERALGRPPMVYTGPGFWDQYRELLEDTVIARCPLWMAAYLHVMPNPPKPWEHVTMWQYQGSAPGFIGQVDGIVGAVDRSHLYGGIESIRVG